MTSPPDQMTLVTEPKRKRAPSLHKRKRWTPKERRTLIRELSTPEWNIHVVARGHDRSIKGIWNEAADLRDKGKLPDLPPWSVVMAQTDPLLAPTEPVAPPHEPGAAGPESFDGVSLSEAFRAAPADAVVSKRLPRDGHRLVEAPGIGARPAAVAPVPVTGTAGVFVQAPVSVASQLMQTVLAALAAVDAPFDGVTVQFVRGA